MTREEVSIDEVKELLERSDYRVVVTRNIRIAVSNDDGILANIDFYNRSILVSLYTGESGITIELARYELVSLLPILALTRRSPAADLYLSLFNDWSESMKFDLDRDYVQMGMLRLHPVGSEICVNFAGISVIMGSIAALRVNLAVQAFDRALGIYTD